MSLRHARSLALARAGSHLFQSSGGTGRRVNISTSWRRRMSKQERAAGIDIARQDDAALLIILPQASES